MIYEAVNEFVYSMVPAGTHSVLDLGCGSGALGARLLNSNRCREVVGVTNSEEEAEQCKQNLTRVIVKDLNGDALESLGQYDCIIASHVLEHLYRPEVIMDNLTQCLRPGGVMIVALPNVLVFRQRMKFLFGRFEYTDGGIMDSTHYRFFDYSSAKSLMSSSSLVLDIFVVEGHFPTPVIRKLIPAISNLLDRLMVSTWPGLFGWQFVGVLRHP